jgi:hypothetical protein
LFSSVLNTTINKAFLNDLSDASVKKPEKWKVYIVLSQKRQNVFALSTDLFSSSFLSVYRLLLCV